MIGVNRLVMIGDLRPWLMIWDHGWWLEVTVVIWDHEWWFMIMDDDMWSWVVIWGHGLWIMVEIMVYGFVVYG